MWLYLPGWPSSSLGTADSDSESPSQPGPSLWCTSSGKPTLRPSSWHGWKTRPWRALLSGTTCPPLTAERFAASWIASLAEAPAKTCPSPASALASTDPALCSGEKCSGLLSKQGLLLFSGRTSEEQSPPRSTWLRTTLAASATELRDALSLLKMSGPRTTESGSSCWPTPTAQRYGSQTNPGAAPRQSLDAIGKNWPTPSCGDVKGPNHSTTNANDSTSTRSLATLAFRHVGEPRTPGIVGVVLNPEFVEALMGLPPGWTSATIGSMRAATASAHSKPPSRFSSAGAACLEASDV